VPTAVLLIVLWGLFFEAHAQKREYTKAFGHLGTKEGLSQSIISEIEQDQYGFMWFGTLDGLNQYNGYQNKQYKHDIDHDRSLSNNRIRFVKKGANGRLWVGTDEGLNFIDPSVDRVFRVRLPLNLDRASITDAYLDTEGRIWVSCQQRLFWIDTKKKKIVPHELKDDTLPQSALTRVVAEDRQGNIYLVRKTNKGDALYQYHPVNNSYRVLLMGRSRPKIG